MQGDLIDRFRPCGAQARVGDRHRRNSSRCGVRVKADAAQRAYRKAIRCGYGFLLGEQGHLFTDDNYPVYRSMYTSDLRSISTRFTSYYIKGDHIRLNEIYLGYDLPERWLSRQNVFRRVNVYAQASNLGVIWSANKDMDPDYTVGNIKPIPTFTFGLRLNFKNW